MTQREAEALVKALCEEYDAGLNVDDEGDIVDERGPSERERFVYDWAERIRREAGHVA